MILTAISTIHVPENRQRREFPPAKQKELEDSILSLGLFNAIVCRKVSDGNYELVAGERRLRAISKIAEDKMIYYHDGMEVIPGVVPVTLLADLSPIELEEVQLDENIRRLDLTWQERAAALNKIAELRRANAPVGDDGKLEVPTKVEIAQEIAEVTGSTPEAARAELMRAEFVAKHMDNPKVASARSLKEAYSIASRETEALFAEQLHAGTQVSEHTIWVGNAVELLKGLTPGTFDCIITDPPYGMGANSFGDAGAEHHYDDSEENAFKLATAILEDGYDLCKEQAHLYMFCDPDLFVTFRKLAKGLGWTPWRTPLIWDKGGASGHNPIPSQSIRRSYEFILYAFKGEKPGIVFMSDVIRGITPVANASHPAEKPTELYERLLSRSVRAGDAILDPCCGVGPVFEAANKMKLRATGIELDPDFARIASARRFPKVADVDSL